MFEIESVPHSSSTGPSSASGDPENALSAQQIIGEITQKMAQNSVSAGSAPMTPEALTPKA